MTESKNIPTRGAHADDEHIRREQHGQYEAIRSFRRNATAPDAPPKAVPGNKCLSWARGLWPDDEDGS
jgi:hypothetical protein